jgi:hypothetical protein
VTAPTPARRTFWICAALGWSVIGYGIWGLIDNSSRTNPGQWIRWFAGSLIAHDLVVAPLTFAIGALFVSRIPRRIRAPFQAGLIASAVIVLTAWPLVRGYGLRADNPSALPNNYLAGLAMVLVVVWSAVAVVAVRTWKRQG